MAILYKTLYQFYFIDHINNEKCIVYNSYKLKKKITIIGNSCIIQCYSNYISMHAKI